MTQIYIPPFISLTHEQSSSYHSRPVDDSLSLREFQELGSYTSQYQNYRRSTWEARSPMSDHKKTVFEPPPLKAGDMIFKGLKSNQNAPREQLPPLSSLFGSTPSSHSSYQSRSAQSPYSDRHSPVFAAVSPHDGRQQRAAPIHPDRPYESSYFQRLGAVSQFPYKSRPEPVERHDFSAPPRPAPAGTRPESPRCEAQYTSSESSRTTHPSGWSPHSPASRPEYFARDTSSSFRPHTEHRPHPPQAHRFESEPRPAHRHTTHSTLVTPNYPPTPASTVAGDAATTKEGLGPKIWTGTQFLPRFVRQAEVPGEGVCYFYDDGTHCKTSIDGEIVNAHWGVTKAGKPRKRLAIACITCREKKIKCDPDYPRCIQCEKFGRVCKFKNAPRGGQGSPDTPPADPEDLIPRPASSRTAADSFKVEQRENSQSVSPRQILRRATPDSEIQPSKRQRTSYTHFTPIESEASPRLSVRETTSPTNTWLDTLVTSPINHSLLRDWQVNPYISNPALVAELLDASFKHVPVMAHGMFPEGPFKAWVLTAGEKSLDDLMLIYSILALGTVCSSKPEHKAVGSQYASISRYACDNRHFSIQLVQSRLMIGLYYFALNHPNDSWDACGGAIRAACGLKLNVEIEMSEDAYLTTFPYGLNRHGYAECRRRTFWTCYLLDRFSGISCRQFSVIHPEDIFLRLPCDAKSFESQAKVENPYFDFTTPPIVNSDWTIGSMAYLINISTIWGEVLANIYRATQRPTRSTSNFAFMAFNERTTQRLREWKDSLPNCYQFSAENLARAADSGNLSTYLSMHTVYHTTAMKLSRYVQHSALNASQIVHHVSIAQHHAETLLVIVDALAARYSSMPSPVSLREQSATIDEVLSPFVGYSILSAIDILSAKVSYANLPTRLSSFNRAQLILGEIAPFWQSARIQQALVLQRIKDLVEITTGKAEAGVAGTTGFKFGEFGATVRGIRDGIFEMRDPIDKTYPRDYDCVYA